MDRYGSGSYRHLPPPQKFMSWVVRDAIRIIDDSTAEKIHISIAMDVLAALEKYPKE
jgi:hypothetical protein